VEVTLFKIRTIGRVDRNRGRGQKGALGKYGLFRQAREGKHSVSTPYTIRGKRGATLTRKENSQSKKLR